MKTSIEYAALAPIEILLTAGVLSILIEAFVPRIHRRTLQLFLVFGSIVVAFGYLVASATQILNGNASVTGGQTQGIRELAASGSVAIDGPGLFTQCTLLIVAIEHFSVW